MLRIHVSVWKGLGVDLKFLSPSCLKGLRLGRMVRVCSEAK